MKSNHMKLFIKLQFLIGLIVITLLSVTVMVSATVAAPDEAQSVAQNDAIAGLGIGAGLAIGLAGLGAGLGLGTASSAAIGAISERPEVFGRTIIFVAFIEGIGVFGFVIAFLLYLLASA
ncbi:MAG: V-type ATP synthase subunit K [Candidatus Hodarchaeales archaeon]